MKRFHRFFATALALIPALFLSGLSTAQTYNVSAPNVRIEGFNVEEVRRLTPGTELNFDMYGTPGGKMDLAINGVKGKIFLNEINSGEYSGTYTIKRRDRITPNSLVTANLRVGERVTSATLDSALQLASSASPVTLASVCPNCGTIEAIDRIEVKGDGGYLGALGGGVVGAVLGSQVGSGKGKTAAQIAGALGGAYAGYVIEGKVRKAYHYEVLVRLQNGTTQTVSYATAPDFRVGDAVKINDGVLVRNI